TSDSWYLKLEKGQIREITYLAHAMILFLLGALIGYLSENSIEETIRMGLSFLIWTVVFRTMVGWHITWSVNSICHKFGYKNFKTNDASKNNLIIGLIAGGEGWHNNHHADPTSATTKVKWWEIDMTYFLILILKRLKLAE